MASTTAVATSSSSYSAASRHLIDANKKVAAPSFRNQSQCMMVSLPSLPSPAFHSHTRLAKTTAYCGKISRNVVALATGEAPAATTTEVVAETPEIVGEAPAATATEVVAETPEIVKTIQQTWDKVDDKYAVTSLAVAGGVALWASAGMISAIDRLPLIPGVLELVGIGYTGWFAYKNLAFTPKREALFQKIKDTYNDILGTS